MSPLKFQPPQVMGDITYRDGLRTISSAYPCQIEGDSVSLLLNTSKLSTQTWSILLILSVKFASFIS